MNSKVNNKGLQGSCAPCYEQPVKVQASMPVDTGNEVYGSQTFKNVTEPVGGTKGDGTTKRSPRD